MLKIETILKEIKDIPANRLEELYDFIHTLTPDTKSPAKKGLKKKILSYGGAFNDMSKKDYKDFLAFSQQMRIDSFDRKINL